MDPQQEQILEHQKNTWNKFAPGWKKWDEFTMNFLKPMGDAIIASIQPKEGDKVLDVATGTGEPGLTIASMVGRGSVVGTDISENMLSVAEEHAQEKNISNYTTRACDISNLPFDKGSFDAVSCRMGFMFFPDMQQAANEMVRVLKNGGRLATSVWAAAPQNPWVTIMMGSIGKFMEMPAPPPGAPGMFRCAAPGMIREMLEKAGLKTVEEKQVKGKLNYASADEYWQNMNEIAAPVVNMLSKATDEQVKNIKEEVYSKLAEQSTSLDFAAIIISGEK
jgi:SAM-dependent methyltransferase